MIRLKTRPLFAGALLFAAALFTTPSLLPRASAQTVGYATQVLDYTVGTGGSVSSFPNPNAALGQPGGNVGSGTLNPFSPPFAGSELTGIGAGGQLTLGLSNFVTVGAAGTLDLGFYGNVGLINVGASGSPAAANPATAFGVRSVLVAVSADGVNFVAVNGGMQVVSTLPANFYTNPDTTNTNAAPPANPTFADFGQPFAGTLASFNGETYAQTLATLNGSAGGTWLDLSGTGLSKVGYVRFSEPATGGANGGVFYLNGVSSNEGLLGAAVPTVPEPGPLAWSAGLAAAGLLFSRKKRLGRAALAAACVLVGAGGAVRQASAQMFGFADIQNWTGTGSNEAAVVIDWNDGKTPESIAWGYRWNGDATGLQMLQAIDLADPRLVVFTVNDPSFGAFVYGMGYDLNNNGGTFTPGTPGDATTENGAASDPGDHYAEGFNTKYWAYYNSDAGSPYGGGGAWAYANDGAASRVLVNGSWDGWSISDANFNAPTPDFPTAAAANVPEPSAWLILAVGGAVVGVAVRRRREWTA